MHFRQCSDKNAIQIRNKCNVNVKILLSQCLNETENKAFSKIEDIAQRLYNVICSIDKEKAKRERRWILHKLKTLLIIVCITNCRFLLTERTRVFS